MLTYEIAEEIRAFAQGEGEGLSMKQVAEHYGYDYEPVRKLLNYQTFQDPNRAELMYDRKYCEADADRMRIEKAFSKDEQLWELALRS